MKSIVFIICILVACAQQAQKTKESEVIITPDDPDSQHQPVDEYIQREIDESKKMYNQILNFKHSQDFGFVVGPETAQDFIFAVEVDEDMEAVLTSYAEQDGAFIFMNRTEGQQIKVSVYEDGHKLLGTWEFYHTRGMLFHAKKQHQYVMRVSTKGRNKLVVINIQHFIYRGSTEQAAKNTTIKTHEVQMQGLKEKLISFMRVSESNHIINELIAENVRLHMNRYMGYQVFQGLVIFVFAVAQGYFIRRLLNKGYSIV